jgi:hypothetical protein
MGFRNFLGLFPLSIVFKVWFRTWLQGQKKRRQQGSLDVKKFGSMIINYNVIPMIEGGDYCVFKNGRTFDL